MAQAPQRPNDIKNVIDGWMKDREDNLHTAMPGTVVAYDASTNRAQVQPFGRKKFFDGRALPYPIIHNVPVVFPMGMGGRAGMTFPVQKGDGCLLVFAESQLDDYRGGGDSDDTRSHDMNDAICIPGLYSGAVPSNMYHGADVCLFHGDSLVTLNGGSFSGALGDGTTFSFGGGDLVVNGISLTKHVHGGVMSGGSKTSTPE